MKTERGFSPGLPVNAERGFSLVELMIALAVLAILAAIVWPSYSAYVQRGRILEAVTRLSEARAKMEQYFLDQRSYVDASGACGVPPSSPGAADAFALACTGTASTYTYTATGTTSGAMAAFAYSIDETGLRRTASVPANWSRRADCWTIRQDGFCL
ncbi:MAG TPA: type IV pilin protein [Casimicrobiaceae bacterium]